MSSFCDEASGPIFLRLDEIRRSTISSDRGDNQCLESVELAIANVLMRTASLSKRFDKSFHPTVNDMANNRLDPCAHGQARKYPEHVRHCSWYAIFQQPIYMRIVTNVAYSAKSTTESPL